MIDEADIWEAAGKNAKYISAIDYSGESGEYGDYLVYLKNGWEVYLYNTGVIGVSESGEDIDSFEYMMTNVVKEVK